MFRLNTLFASALLGLSMAASAQTDTEIKFGVDPSYPPFEVKQPDGSLSGFDIDLGNAICAELKVRCIWVEQPFDGMIPALKAKKFDAILSAFSATEVRRKQVDFSHRLYNGPSALIAKEHSSLLPTAESLKGKTVGVMQGSAQEMFAKAEWSPHDVNILSYQSQDQVYIDLISGRLDAAFQPAVQGDIGFLQKPQGQGFAFAGEPLTDKRLTDEGVAIGIRKGDDPLREKLNTAIASIRASGEYDKLASKYFNFDIYGK
ncbi:ABC transporter substrate-binding protein [Pseudomonas fluorescens]|uniref:ABC transporter substrate-binding protein n=1 Tax=Pseudomonas fluorescens TaxID=294 RepID=A0A327MZ91_PSEFL|nr:ABC transporter substrate-binding protein [Pseudomonas fluorescens]RAI65438.1 ABC transporter substrate-binding protein [Pseudomonas fluorescens]